MRKPFLATKRPRRTKSRLLAISIPLICGTVALAGSPVAQAAPSTITLNFWGTEAASYYNPAIAAYEKLNPSIKVVYHVFPFDDLDTIISSHMSTHDSSYAVYEVDEPRAEEFAGRGWLVPVTSPSLDELQKIVAPEQLSEVTFNGKVWALPLITSTQLLYYNKTLLAKAGVTPPPLNVNARWTWQELYAAALKVHQKTGEAGLYYEQTNRIYQLQPLPQGLGGGPGVTGPQGLTADVDNAAWIQAMEFYQQCFTSGVTPKSVNAEETVPDFEAGDAGFIWAGPWDYYPIMGTKGLSVGIAPTPHWPGRPAETPTDSWAVGVNPYSPYKSQGMAFVKWLGLSNLGATTLMQYSGTAGGGTGKFPGNPPANLAALAAYWKLWPTPLANLMKYELSHTAIHRAHTIGWVQFETVIEQAFTSISDGSNVKAVLANAQANLTEDFSAIKSQQ